MNEMNMEKSPSTKILHNFYRAYGIGAFILYCLLILFVFPWWQASNHPVIFTLGASSGTRMELNFENDGVLPLAPLGKEANYYKQWATELPARPDYSLSLNFPDGISGNVVLSEIKVLTLSPERRERKISLENIVSKANDKVTIRQGATGWVITSSPGGSIGLDDEPLKASPGSWVPDLLKATVGYLLVSGMALLLLATALRFPNRIRGRQRTIRKREFVFLIGIVFAGSMIHMHLVGNSMPDYWPADSTSYTMKGVSLLTDGTYDTGTHEYELNRMPGYPVFMALVFKVAGWNLNALTFAQGLYFCLSMLVLPLSLKRLVPGYISGLAAFLALVSPAAVWASRQIATESTFASTWMLGTAAFIFLWNNKGTKRWIGWILFSIAVVVAVSIRPNGILLLALPGFLFIGASWWAVSVRGWKFWKLKVFWDTCLQVAIPCLVVLLFVGLWSWRNYQSRGYPKATDLTEVVWANAPFFSGTFDIRAAKDEKEYNWFVNERANSGYWFHGWSLRKYRFREITNQYQNIQDSSIQELEDELAEFNAASDKLIPLRAKLVGWGHVAGWGLFFPKIGAHTTDPLNQNYKVAIDFPSEKREEQIRKNLKWATRKTDKEIQLKKARSDPWIYLYNSTLVPVYPWLYRLLFIGSLFGWMFALAERKYLAAALVTPYLANILLNVYFMYIIGRYVQVLDAVLWFALVTGLTCLYGKCLQEPTTESDRRCNPPIKPKRLMTRFSGRHGTPL